MTFLPINVGVLTRLSVRAARYCAPNAICGSGICNRCIVTYSGVTEGPALSSRGWGRYGISPINERQSPLISLRVLYLVETRAHAHR